MYDYSTSSLQREILRELETMNSNFEIGMTTCITLLLIIIIAILAYGLHDILNHALGRGE